MSLRCQQASQMVRAATRLHRDNATRQLGGERENRLATHPPAQDHGPIPVDAYQATDVLAQVDAQYDYCHGSLLLSFTTSILPMLRKQRRSQVGAARLIFIDEPWTKTNMTRLHGRCARGQRLVGKVPHGLRKTLT